MNVANVMTELATQLDTITGLRVFAFPPDNIAAPAAIVGFPETITYDVTMGRGVDQIDLPIFVLVGRVTDRTAWANMAPYLAGSGSSSVKAVLKAGTYTAFASARVASAEIEAITMAGIDYLAAIFTVNVFGTGA